ncbi:MAG: protein translocase subunit SecD, partial [Clostridia bacterium]|nr:protein translocase subunit SecD [Clostridia bacterium]
TVTRITDLISDEYPEALISVQDGNRIRVEVPDVSDPEEVFDLIGQPASLAFKAEEDTDDVINEAVITGQDIVTAYASQQPTADGTYEYGVSIEFTDEGAQKFYDLTKQNEGKQIYIYRNGELFSAPTVNEPIAGGKTFISGSMDTFDAAEDFATQILSGTFSLELTLLENTVVSATLGVDALKYGLIAGGIALILIFAFMIWRYRMMGVMASVALCFYVILMLFFLQALPFVQLTLAGIAGIILSIGMAIDGNIIIFERIKEEYATGKRIAPSVRAGFKKSFWAIFDSNITTIAVSVILIILGTGSIRGFAMTLLIGVALSMFTSLVLTRGLLNMYYPLNTQKASHYSLKREEDVVELA